MRQHFHFSLKEILISQNDYKQTNLRIMLCICIIQRSLHTYVLLPVGVKTGKKREEKTMADVKVKLPPVLTLRRKQKFRFLACKKVTAIRRKVPAIYRKVLDVNRRKVPAICKKVSAIFRKAIAQFQESSCHLQGNSRNFQECFRPFAGNFLLFARNLLPFSGKFPPFPENENNFSLDCK